MCPAPNINSPERQPVSSHAAGDDLLPVHYLHTSPSPIFGIVALVLSLALLAAGISQLKQTRPHETALTLQATAGAVSGGAVRAPVLHVTPENWSINGQPVRDTDLLFRLSGLAGQSQVIIIEHTAGLSAERLTRALETVNRAGFVQVGIRTMAAASGAD